jgi:hypothetical protein
MTAKSATRVDIRRLLGDISDHTLLAILETGATLSQLEEVEMWLAQEDDVMGEERRPLTGVPAQILGWLESDEDYRPEE